MSAQCWCYVCAGRVVSRSTFYNHGRKNKPDSPARDPVPLPVESAMLPRVAVDPDDIATSDSDTDESESDEEMDLLGMRDSDARTGRANLTAGGLYIYVYVCAYIFTCIFTSRRLPTGSTTPSPNRNSDHATRCWARLRRCIHLRANMEAWCG